MNLTSLKNYVFIIVFLCLNNQFIHAINDEIHYWDDSNLPNPLTEDGFQRCGMTESALLCDPDHVLLDEERFLLNKQLMAFENATVDPTGETFCKRKGATVAIAIINNVRPDLLTQSNFSMFAVQVHANWKLDSRCRKSFVIVLPVSRWHLISRDFNYEAPVFYDEFSFYFFREHETFLAQNYYQGLSNIVNGLRNAIILKRQLVNNQFSNSVLQYLNGDFNAYLDPRYVLSVAAISVTCCLLMSLLWNIFDRLRTRKHSYETLAAEKKHGIQQHFVENGKTPISVISTTTFQEDGQAPEKPPHNSNV